LKYIGFGGTGRQVRDCMHPRDLASLVAMQLRDPSRAGQTLNVGGGAARSMSLRQLSHWCSQRFGEHEVAKDPKPRPFDVPWLILDCSKAQSDWKWQPAVSLETILSEIAEHAEANPQWLELSAGS